MIGPSQPVVVSGRPPQLAERPLLSILTPTLNPGAALRATAESLARQTFRDFEWIIKDAGSNDGTLHASLPMKHRMVVASDVGIYDAINQAVFHARGRYVQVLAAGDCFAHSRALEELATALDSHDEPDLVYCSATHRPSGTRWTHPARLHDWFLYRGAICHQAQFWSRVCLEALGGYDLSYEIAADREMLVRARKRHDIRTKRVDLDLVTYAGGGFSERPENRARLEAEIRRIRRTRFNVVQRAGYGLVHALTLPGWRSRWNDAAPDNRWASAYQSLRSWVRRFI
jgi:glycosyltransferase involved in cell wall biosynthesis